MARPPALTQVAARTQRGGEPVVASDHESEPTVSADPCHCLPEGRPAGILIVAEHNAGETARQPHDHWPRVSQAVIIGEQPKRR